MSTARMGESSILLSASSENVEICRHLCFVGHINNCCTYIKKKKNLHVSILISPDIEASIRVNQI